jgi:hypothetical protein
VIFKQRELDGIGRRLLPGHTVLLHGGKPALKAGQLEIIARDDNEQSDRQAVLLAVAVDAGCTLQAMLDGSEERLLIGWSKAQIAGECGEQVRGVRGGMDPAFDGIEAAVVALVAQVSERVGEQCPVLGG